jgi:FSR family fosmidomycin resistance protein-like MFS transporter
VVFGLLGAAWPLIRTDLRLGYASIGLLIALPGMAGALVQPALGILADSGHRSRIVVAGGVAFGLALALFAAARSYGAVMVAALILSPASGAFVSLSQATLMDLDPDRHERNMARWTLAGSVGVVTGPLLLSLFVSTGLGWRASFFVAAALTVPALLSTRGEPHVKRAEDIGVVVGRALSALRSRSVLRWLLVLEVTDLLGDVLLGFLALYVVDVVRVGPAEAGLTVAIWSAAGLAGDALLLAVLRRLDGLRWLRWSAVVALVMYPAFLLAHDMTVRLVLVALLGVVHAGWYSIPKARLFSELHGSSGVAVALSDVSGLLAAFIPLAIGASAARFGLGPVMWGLLLAPVGILIFVPRSGR